MSIFDVNTCKVVFFKNKKTIGCVLLNVSLQLNIGQCYIPKAIYKTSLVKEINSFMLSDKKCFEFHRE